MHGHYYLISELSILFNCIMLSSSDSNSRMLDGLICNKKKVIEIKKVFYSHSLGSIQLLKSTKNQIVSKAHAECEFWPQTCVVAGKCGGNYHMQMRKNDRRRSTPLRCYLKVG